MLSIGIASGAGEKSRVWQELGCVLRTANRTGEAVACFKEALRLNDRLAPAYRNLARIRTVEGRVEEAEDLLRVGCQKTSRHAPLWEDLGLVLETRTNASGAMGAYQRAVDLDPRAVFSWNRLGVLAFRAGRGRLVVRHPASLAMRGLPTAKPTHAGAVADAIGAA